MKKIIFLLLLATNISIGQITFETTYTSTAVDITPVNLNPTLTVYQTFNQSNNQVTLFNQNHSVYKAFIIPAQAGTYGFNWGIQGYYSESLFNSDNLVEYIVSANKPPINSQNNYLMKIYNESGTILFQKDSILDAGGISIFNSPAGTKMFLYQIINSSATFVKHVYSLPGSLFSKVKEITKVGTELNVFPNPSYNYFKVEYKLPDNVIEGVMEIYNTNGQLLKSFRISNQMHDILIDANELSNGSYYLKIIVGSEVLSSKLIKL